MTSNINSQALFKSIRNYQRNLNKAEIEERYIQPYNKRGWTLKSGGFERETTRLHEVGTWRNGALWIVPNGNNSFVVETGTRSIWR